MRLAIQGGGSTEDGKGEIKNVTRKTVLFTSEQEGSSRKPTRTERKLFQTILSFSIT